MPIQTHHRRPRIKRGRQFISKLPLPAIARVRQISYTLLVQEGEKQTKIPNFSAWQLAWELGYTIAIPIVLFALLGRLADKYFDTSPWLLLAGVILSVVMSSFLVYRKVRGILK